jgi:hypothetical protein
LISPAKILQGLPVGEIAVVSAKLASVLRHLALYVTALQLKRAAHANDIRARLRKSQRHSFSDSALAARYDRDLAVQPEQFEHSFALHVRFRGDSVAARSLQFCQIDWIHVFEYLVLACHAPDKAISARSYARMDGPRR